MVTASMDETPTFLDEVDIVGDDGMGLLHCRRRGRNFHVPRYNLLGGGAGVQVGTRDVTLILPRWFVRNLGFESADSGPFGRAHVNDPARARRVLVVEDDADSRDALCALLECWGHHVVCASSGQQALGFAVEMRLDSIIFNLLLPDMGGGEFARTLRSVRLAPAPQLVGYSSLPQDADLPVDDYIQKPDVRELERLFGPAADPRELTQRRRRSR
jgi:CheY-like chemotaxis protein